MKRLVNMWLIIFFSWISGGMMLAEEGKIYWRYVDEITNEFLDEMEKQTGLRCGGSGGSMPYDHVKEIDVKLVGERRATLEEARALEVMAIQKLLAKINAHEKIRPFLEEYPFTENRVGISISFRNKKKTMYYLDGSVAFVSNGRNKLFYSRAEKRLIKHDPCYDAETGGIYRAAYEKEEERLVDLMDEPYEEAVKLVAAAHLPQPSKK